MARRTTSQARPRRSSPVRAAFLSRAVLCDLGGISERQLAVWEFEELLAPARVIDVGGRREPLYNRETLRRIRVIRTLAEELDVNLPGIGIILHLLDQLGR
ncbi:MAG TPA: MerR family transcriptional regulator [Candidatus Binataceae bacterium]|nr:MerR family transcriptional regulator [Candidatus Binataceae bacterium]